MNKFPTKEDQGTEIPIERDIEVNGDLGLSDGDESRDFEEDSRIEKLHRRVTLSLILVPCLVGAILLFAYLDLKKRVNEVQNRGSTEVKTLSKNVVGKVGSLSDQYKTLEASFAERVAALEKSFVSIKEDLKKTKREIKKLNASAVDKKVFEGSLKKQSAEVAKNLAVTERDLQEQKQALEKLNETLKKEVAAMVHEVDRIRGRRQRDASAIDDLTKRKVDKKVFDRIVKDERASYEETRSLLQKEMTSLKKEVFQLQQYLNVAPKAEAKTAPDEKKPRSEASKDTLSPAHDKIVEQEISE